MSVRWREAISKQKSLIFIVLLAALTIRVIVPQLDELWGSVAALKGADLWWILLGVLAYFLGIPILAAQINALAQKSLQFLMTLKVQMAALFVSKLLPNGIGSISLNVYYLIKKKHTPGQAATVMTMNAITSAIAYLFLILLALFTSSISFYGLEGNVDIPTNLILFLIILFLGIIFSAIYSSKIRLRVKKLWVDLKANLAIYKKRPASILVAIVCNGVGSLTSIFALFVSAKAVGVDLTLAEALLAYTLGNFAAALIPTPGGLGAIEAGIYGGLVLVGIDGADATLITLLYRLITYWIPIIPGYIFFWGLRKNLLADFSWRKRYSST